MLQPLVKLFLWCTCSFFPSSPCKHWRRQLDLEGNGNVQKGSVTVEPRGGKFTVFPMWHQPLPCPASFRHNSSALISSTQIPFWATMSPQTTTTKAIATSASRNFIFGELFSPRLAPMRMIQSRNVNCCRLLIRKPSRRLWKVSPLLVIDQKRAVRCWETFSVMLVAAAKNFRAEWKDFGVNFRKIIY